MMAAGGREGDMRIFGKERNVITNMRLSSTASLNVELLMQQRKWYVLYPPKKT